MRLGISFYKWCIHHQLFLLILYVYLLSIIAVSSLLCSILYGKRYAIVLMHAKKWDKKENRFEH